MSDKVPFTDGRSRCVHVGNCPSDVYCPSDPMAVPTTQPTVVPTTQPTAVPTATHAHEFDTFVNHDTFHVKSPKQEDASNYLKTYVRT